jgi:hypothetical protein
VRPHGLVDPREAAGRREPTRVQEVAERLGSHRAGQEREGGQHAEQSRGHEAIASPDYS